MSRVIRESLTAHSRVHTGTPNNNNNNNNNKTTLYKAQQHGQSHYKGAWCHAATAYGKTSDSDIMTYYLPGHRLA